GMGKNRLDLWVYSVALKLSGPQATGKPLSEMEPFHFSAWQRSDAGMLTPHRSSDRTITVEVRLQRQRLEKLAEALKMGFSSVTQPPDGLPPPLSAAHVRFPLNHDWGRHLPSNKVAWSLSDPESGVVALVRPGFGATVFADVYRDGKILMPFYESS